MKQIFAPKNSKTKKKIVGRGTSSGKGRTAGRGHDGNKQRAGGTILLGFEGGQMALVRRLPKFGFSNEPHRRDVEVITLRSLELIADKLQEISIPNLKNAKVVSKQAKFVKIIGNGNFTKKVTICADVEISKAAAEKIKSAGGKVDSPNVG